jgi:hypothetical protein
MHLAFCSRIHRSSNRDHLCSVIFVSTSIVIRHAARETSIGPLQENGGHAQESIATTTVHNASRVNFARRSAEMFESQTNNLLGLQPRTPSHRLEGSEGTKKAASRVKASPPRLTQNPKQTFWVIEIV